MSYRKHFIPLESNPTVFTELAHGLGLSPELEFHDVFSLDEPDLLSLIPRPALALVLVFPTSPNYEADLQQLDKQTPEYSKSGADEDVVWFKQTINNACGLYGILHAVTNGAARDFIRQYNPPLFTYLDLTITSAQIAPRKPSYISRASQILGPRGCPRGG